MINGRDDPLDWVFCSSVLVLALFALFDALFTLLDVLFVLDELLLFELPLTALFTVLDAVSAALVLSLAVFSVFETVLSGVLAVGTGCVFAVGAG